MRKNSTGGHPLRVPHPFRQLYRRRGWGIERSETALPLSPQKRRWTSLALLLTLTIALLGAATTPEAQFNKLGHEMICTCGCTQILLECNHVGCPVSPVMIDELHTQLNPGGPDNLILNWFAAKYGATVLAAPMRGGFDNVAWITPMAVFFLATVGVAFMIRVWKLRGGIPASPAGTPPIAGDAIRAQIRRETEY